MTQRNDSSTSGGRTPEEIAWTAWHALKGNFDWPNFKNLLVHIIAAERTATGGEEMRKAAVEKAREGAKAAERQYLAAYGEGNHGLASHYRVAQRTYENVADAIRALPAAAAPAVPAPDKPLTPADIPIRPEGYSSEELRILDPINPAFFDAVRPAPDKAQEERAQEVMTYIGFLIYVDGMKKTAETFIQGTARIAAALSTAHASGREEGERASAARIEELETGLRQALGIIVEFGDLNGFRNLSDEELGRAVLEGAKRFAALLSIPFPSQERVEG